MNKTKPKAVGDNVRRQQSICNVPNALCAVRLIAAGLMIYAAVAHSQSAFLWLTVVALLTDWLDGKLAVLLEQRTVFGARLDSVADAAMYGALFFGVFWLKPDFIRDQWVWIVVAGCSYALTIAAGLCRFGKLPSYHTRAAKTGWLLISVAAITIFADGPAWPFRLAMLGVTLTNIEAALISCVLPEARTDVPTILHAWRIRQKSFES